MDPPPPPRAAAATSEVCGARLSIRRVPGYGVDRTQMRELLKLTPRERVEGLRRDAAGLARLDRAAATPADLTGEMARGPRRGL